MIERLEDRRLWSASLFGPVGTLGVVAKNFTTVTRANLTGGQVVAPAPSPAPGSTPPSSNPFSPGFGTGSSTGPDNPFAPGFGTGSSTGPDNPFAV